MTSIRRATPNDFIEGYPYLDLATRSMLARRANMAPGITVAALHAKQAAADRAAPKARYRTTWDDTPERNVEELAARERVIHRADDFELICTPAPHDKTLLELQETFMDSAEFHESVKQYIAGNVNHPLVSKFGWGKDKKVQQ